MNPTGTLVVATFFVWGGSARGHGSPWALPVPPRASVSERWVSPASEGCEPRHYEYPYAEYLATGSEVEAIPFVDTVFGGFRGLRLVVDLSRAPMTLPRGVWWIGIQPFPDGSINDTFYQVLDKMLRVGRLPHVYYTHHFWGWQSLDDLLGQEAGDLGMKIVADGGQVLLDSTYMTDKQVYTNGFYNQPGGEDVRLADDFFLSHEVTIVKVVGDYLTRSGESPARGVWVRIYENVACPRPVLEGPFPGRAGEVNELQAADLRPGDAVHFVWGVAPGGFPIPGCGGASVDIANPVYLGRASADAEGLAALSFFVPEYARGRVVLFQALQRTTCLQSRVAAHTFE